MANCKGPIWQTRMRGPGEAIGEMIASAGSMIPGAGCGGLQGWLGIVRILATNLPRQARFSPRQGFLRYISTTADLLDNTFKAQGETEDFKAFSLQFSQKSSPRKASIEPKAGEINSQMRVR